MSVDYAYIGNVRDRWRRWRQRHLYFLWQQRIRRVHC